MKIEMDAGDSLEGDCIEDFSDSRPARHQEEISGAL
jgi:hypothetical protein